MFQAALVPHQHEEGLGAAHQALLQREGPTGFQAFTRPPCFGARIAGLLGLMVREKTLLVITLHLILTARLFPGSSSPWLQCLYLCGLVDISLLCGLQRGTGKLWNTFSNDASQRSVYVLISLKCFRVYELYTSATGLYLCLVIAKGSLMLASWIRQVGYL